MAAGDVTCQILENNSTVLDSAMTNLRVTENDKYYVCSINNKNNLVLAHVEET